MIFAFIETCISVYRKLDHIHYSIPQILILSIDAGDFERFITVLAMAASFFVTIILLSQTSAFANKYVDMERKLKCYEISPLD